jgi:hypothetical protein
MKKALFTLVLAFLFVSNTYAQTTQIVAWSYLAETLANVQALSQQLTINGTASTAVITCVQNAANVDCSATVPALSLTTANTVKLSATKNGVTKETTIAGLLGSNAPKDPSNFRWVIQVTVNIGQ